MAFKLKSKYVSVSALLHGGGVDKPKWGVRVHQITPNHNLAHRNIFCFLSCGPNLCFQSFFPSPKIYFGPLSPCIEPFIAKNI